MDSMPTYRMEIKISSSDNDMFFSMKKKNLSLEERDRLMGIFMNLDFLEVPAQS